MCVALETQLPKKKATEKTKTMEITRFEPGQAEPEQYWYPEVRNATIHPMVQFFFNMSLDQIKQRYCHLHPEADPEAVNKWLTYQPKHYVHSGTDLIYCTNDKGNRRMVIIENNSSPSGQKSMPLLDDYQEMGGYKEYMEHSFKQHLQRKRQIKGCLAVFYDKNLMEARGYAAAMADVYKEEVFLVPYHSNYDTSLVKFEDRTFFIREHIEEEWKPVRALFRYVTQQPWSRFPMTSKTQVLNPIITCIAGGRNKLIASKAYDLFNTELELGGIRIHTPETIWDVAKNEVPIWVEKMGGHAVVKVPYSNAGQGVYTITSERELEDFMALPNRYDRFIVQSLIGNSAWSSRTKLGTLYHVGTMPDKRGRWYAFDLRMVIQHTPNGFKPMAIYGRRAGVPLPAEAGDNLDSWSVLGTNLSFKKEEGWGSDTERLLLMDRKGFNKTGVGLDELIDGFMQSVLSMIAIDQMSERLLNKKGQLKRALFMSLNDDPKLLNELME